MRHFYTIFWSFVLSALTKTAHGQTKPPAAMPCLYTNFQNRSGVG